LEGALTDGSYELLPIGWVESPLVDPATAPKQGDEGSPEAWLVFDNAVREGLGALQAGTDVIVLTWLDRARRDVLRVHPRDDPANLERGVFSTRSADRPNPIGLHPGHHRVDRGHQSPRAQPRSAQRNTHRGRQAGAGLIARLGVRSTSRSVSARHGDISGSSGH
jgi:hypothetical protein